MSHDQIIEAMNNFKRVTPEHDPDAIVLKIAFDSAGMLIGFLIERGILAPGPNWEGE